MFALRSACGRGSRSDGTLRAMSGALPVETVVLVAVVATTGTCDAAGLAPKHPGDQLAPWQAGQIAPALPFASSGSGPFHSCRLHYLWHDPLFCLRSCLVGCCVGPGLSFRTGSTSPAGRTRFPRPPSRPVSFAARPSVVADRPGLLPGLSCQVERTSHAAPTFAGHRCARLPSHHHTVVVGSVLPLPAPSRACRTDHQRQLMFYEACCSRAWAVSSSWSRRTLTVYLLQGRRRCR
jgi:hypothetical protein